MHYHAKSITQTIKTLQSSKSSGLTQKEVLERQKRGRNTLPAAGIDASPLHMFLSQWKSPLILVLVFAGVVSGILGERIDMTIILATAFLNALIGFMQEWKANSALKKLATLASYYAVVLRDGKKEQVKADDLVPGDLVLLSPGQHIPADGRVIAAEGVLVNESILTGESEPVLKDTTPVKEDAGIGDRHSMLHRGTTVTRGTARMIVTAIGANTEIGAIATLVDETEDDETPLQRELARLAKQLTIIVVGIAVLIFAVGSWLPHTESILHLFETAVAVAVAAIPEGMVISLTVILAIGMQFILKRNALVRRLVAAETLGSVSVICTDKTGTLTEGKMKVQALITPSDEIAIEHIKKDSSAWRAVEIGVECNDAEVMLAPDGKETIVGDTTDIALLEAGRDHGMESSGARTATLAFRSEVKYMAVLAGEKVLVKGAPDILLEKCTHYHSGGKRKKFTKDEYARITQLLQSKASKGYRTLAFAEKSSKKDSLIEKDVFGLTWIGFAAIADPVRHDVKQTIALARKAGMRVVMITGDHKKTAAAIGAEIGLATDEKNICDGAALEDMSDAKLQEYVKHATIFARVNPEHKIRIVRAFQQNGEVVAMTGDGINDAPALKGADIGVAVGSGTDVAKETADMVLLDDSFSTIVAAVKEGRGIYENIKKVVVYLLSGSFAEVIMVLGSMFAGMPIAALPAQILWVNVIEDAFPTMALAFDSADDAYMNEPPRPRNARLFDKEIKSIIVLKSVLSNVALFAIFVYMYNTTGDIVLTRTLVFVGFAIDALFYIFSIRNLQKHIWQYNIFSNLYLVGAVLFGWLMLVLAVYAPPLQLVLKTVPLEAWHWGMMVAFGLFNAILIETIKAVFMRRAAKQHYAG